MRFGAEFKVGMVSVACFRTFVKRDHLGLSASDNYDAHADIGEIFWGDGSKLGYICL